MSELVKCPTCGGQLSMNAGECSHCGETQFYRMDYKENGSWKEVDLRTGREVSNSETERAKEVANGKEEQRQLIDSIGFLLQLIGVLGVIVGAVVAGLTKIIGLW